MSLTQTSPSGENGDHSGAERTDAPEMYLMHWLHPRRGEIREVVCAEHESHVLASLTTLGIGCTGEPTDAGTCGRCAADMAGREHRFYLGLTGSPAVIERPALTSAQRATVIRDVAQHVARVSRLVGSMEHRLRVNGGVEWLRQLADATEIGHPLGLQSDAQ